MRDILALWNLHGGQTTHRTAYQAAIIFGKNDSIRARSESETSAGQAFQAADVAAGLVAGGGALVVAVGAEVYVDISGSPRVFNDQMQSALDSVPVEVPPAWHGWCSEIGCMNQALNAGESLAGGTNEDGGDRRLRSRSPLAESSLPDMQLGYEYLRGGRRMISDTLINRYNTTKGGVTEKWRELMRAVGDLVVDYGNLPPRLQTRLTQVNALWAADPVDEDFLRSVKLDCWGFLRAKHGNSTSIVDREDRAIRAMLCLLEPAGDEVAASDTVNWIEEILSPST